MKIAIPSDDGQIVNTHFGRSLGFKIFEIENGKIVSESYKENNFTGHARGEHEHHHHHSHEGHSHQGIFEALSGVTTVIARGMGKRLHDEFVERNVKVFVTREANINEAINKFLNDNLDHSPDACCDH